MKKHSNMFIIITDYNVLLHLSKSLLDKQLVLQKSKVIYLTFMVNLCLWMTDVVGVINLKSLQYERKLLPWMVEW